MHVRWQERSDEVISFSSNEPRQEPLRVVLPGIETGLTASLIELLPESPLARRGRSVRIAIKAGKKILLIETEDVIAVEAKGNCVLLRLASGSHMLRESVAAMEEKLTPHGFVRIHRSVLMNAAWVEEIRPRPAGEYVLRVNGGNEYTVTRSYKKNLRLLAQLWIGNSSSVTE
jgi:two-component system LytT family response regulator